MPVRYWLSLGLIYSVIFGALPVTAQQALQENRQPKADTALSLTRDPVEAFRGLLRIDGKTFAELLTQMTSEEDTANAIEAQSVYFYEQFRDRIKTHLSDVTQKSTEYNQKRYEELTKKPPTKKPAKRLGALSQMPDAFEDNFAVADLARPRGPSSNDVFFVNASYEPNRAVASDITVTETETATSKGATATDVKVIEIDTATITRNNTVRTNLSAEDNTMVSETDSVEKTEAASKTDRSKLTKETKLGWKTSFGICPDAAGILKGKGSSRIYHQTTINTGKQLAALTTEYVIDYEVTAYVNDAAEMTHFDMDGTVTETTFGYDRAHRLRLAENKKGYADGTRSIRYTIKGSTAPSEGPRNAYGTRQDIPAVIGKVTAQMSGVKTNAEAKRVAEANRSGFGMLMINLELSMRSSASSWKNGECVAVECASAKQSLRPGEAADVDTVSVSKLDGSKIHANLDGKGTQSVTPGAQRGKPNAIYTVSAPQKDKAILIVQSVSRRGIGLEVLEIPVVEPKKPKPPVKPARPKDCDGGWTGTVKAVNTTREDITGKADGRLVRSIDSKNAGFSVEINVLGTRDTTGGIVNNFHGTARAGYLETTYRERTYAPGKMGCNTGIIETGQTQKYETQLKGDASGKILVTISVIGTYGHISFTPPEVAAERITTQTYDSKCPSYNAANSSTEPSDSLTAIPTPFFEVEFEANPTTPNQIEGSKTVQNSDGSETTYSWNLVRCG